MFDCFVKLFFWVLVVGVLEGKPLKVYILAGQSNMQGSAHKKTQRP